MIDVVNALAFVDLGDRDDVYHTCRTLLVSRVEQIPVFDRAFAEFFAGRRAPWKLQVTHPSGPPMPAPAAHEEEARGALVPVESGEADAGEGQRDVGMWSDTRGLAQKDFALFSAEEIALARAALERLVWNPGERRTRRWVIGRGPRIDLRRALARSLRTGGDVVTLPRRHRRRRPRTLILLCDVSGSMERYSRMLLHFTHALTRRHRRMEAFLFSTRLTRITMEMRSRRLDDAVTSVSQAVSDWSGGTRIGEALGEFHQRWARRVLHRGPVVLLISDGWDRGEPDVLRDQIARLQRSSHRLVWLNPLIGTVGYAPLTRGLQAALPFVDDFLPARTLNDLGDLAVHLNSLAQR
jgi:uncharacterized protein with von Willebrand factor type A (vWA) domain